MRPVLIATLVSCARPIVAIGAAAAHRSPLHGGRLRRAGCRRRPCSPPCARSTRRWSTPASSPRCSRSTPRRRRSSGCVGPVVATFVVHRRSAPCWVILLAAAILVVGGIWFISSPELGRVRIPRSQAHASGVVLARPAVLLSDDRAASSLDRRVRGRSRRASSRRSATAAPEAGIDPRDLRRSASLAGGLLSRHVPSRGRGRPRAAGSVSSSSARSLAAFAAWDFWRLAVALVRRRHRHRARRSPRSSPSCRRA